MTEVAVIGAGIVGLSTAWHLQKRGFEVTVVDRVGGAAGSSWGNAGWLAPGKAIPLAHPSLWTYGMKALFDPDAALSIPVRLDKRLAGFVAQFMARATPRAWDETMAALTPIDRIALDAFDELDSGGVESWTRESPFIVGFEDESQSRGFQEEVAGAVRHGQEVPLERLPDPQEIVPQLSDRVTTAFRLDGQRFLEPGPYMAALEDSVCKRGAKLLYGVDVVDVSSTRKPVVGLSTGEKFSTDVVVLATGAWLSELAGSLGVRVPVQAGRGYSFTVCPSTPINYPVYFPHQRLACTPYQGRFRIGGTMEFRHPDEAFQPKRVHSMIKHASHLFDGINWDDRRDEWVGSRPVTPDGIPLVGRSQAPNVYIAGGHGMWGFVLGPATGKLLAEQISTGCTSPVISQFDPLR